MYPLLFQLWSVDMCALEKLKCSPLEFNIDCLNVISFFSQPSFKIEMALIYVRHGSKLK